MEISQNFVAFSENMIVNTPHVCKYGNMFWYSKGFSLQDVFQQALQLVVLSFALLAILQGRRS